MSNILLYSGNQGKINEFQEICVDNSIQLIPANQLGITTGIEETGTTFIENAIIKARDGAKKSNMPCIADDSGLIVDYLNGQPGLYSSEYGGKNATTEARITTLLHDMKDAKGSQRSARFYCCLVYLRYELDPQPIVAEGICEGFILDKPTGENGFGYDPVFFHPQYKKPLATLQPEIKHQISHRGIAIRLMKEKLIHHHII